MKVYVGMDLHATNTYVGMVDEENTVLYKQRFRNELPLILAALDPFKKDIQGVVVESTFNWYWLVDGLQKRTPVDPCRSRSLQGGHPGHPRGVNL